MVRRPQWRLLPRRSAAALSAGDPGPGLRLPGRQCRSPVEQSGLAAQLGPAPDPGPPHQGSLRARHDRLPLPSNRKILAYVRAHAEEKILCVANLSGSAQAVELDLSEYRRHRADRDARPVGLPGGRRQRELCADPAGLRLLLVRSLRQEHRRSQRADAAAGLLHARRGQGHRLDDHAAQQARTGDGPAELHRRPALVCRQDRAAAVGEDAGDRADPGFAPSSPGRGGGSGRQRGAELLPAAVDALGRGAFRRAGAGSCPTRSPRSARGRRSER